MTKIRQEQGSDSYQAVVRLLKQILKDRGMTYRELAIKVGLSESGLKKIFSAHDASFNRLSQISGVLGVRFADLLVELEEGRMKGVQFSEHQQSIFLKNLSLFRFFVKLVIERESFESIKTAFNLNQASAFSYLKKLDQMGLIKLLPGDKVKLPPLSLVKNFGEGPLLSLIYQQWGEQIVNELAFPRHQISGNFIVRCLKMKEETYNELLDRLLDLEAEFLKRAVREMSIEITNLKTVRWMWLTDQNSFIKKI